LSLPADKRQKYLSLLFEFRAQNLYKTSVDKAQLEPLVGKLVFAARTFRWGFLFLQIFFDSSYGGMENRDICPLTQGFWDDADFWIRVLQIPATPAGGRTRNTLPSKVLDPDLLSSFQHHLYTDASTSYGWGAVYQDEVVSSAWHFATELDHICWLELRAIRLGLEKFGESFCGSTVLVHTDSMVALALLNKGHSRHRSARLELQAIAVLSAKYGFEVRGVHVAGTENPADQPSRGPAISRRDWTFSEFRHFSHPYPEVDCCADQSGYNSRCAVWYSAENPVQWHVEDLVGKVL
jgi:hypothetical protein